MTAETTPHVERGVSEARAVRAENLLAEWQRFLAVMQVPADTSGILLYLTFLREGERLPTRQIDSRLSYIDLAQRMRGQEPFRKSRDVQTFMRGLAKADPLGHTVPASDPMYREIVDAVIDAVMRPDAEQQAAIAAVLLQDRLRCGVAGLIRLHWRDVTLRRGSVSIQCPSPPGSRGKPQTSKQVTIESIGGPMCPVAALHRWHEQGGRPSDRVFPTLHKSGRGKLRAALVTLRRTGDVFTAVSQASTAPRQLRARALLLLAYGAALTSQEARHLAVGDIEVVPEGLVLRVEGRSYPSLLRQDPGMPGCPLLAWQEWFAVLKQADLAEPDRPAFTRLQQGNPGGEPMSQSGINDVVKWAAAAAGFTRDHYSFSSLRWGAIRTAFRADVPLHSVAHLTGLKAFDGLARHHRREQIVRRSVAGQLGL
ncbi:integrase [Nocardioides thalensis]|uniref:Integrase n=1 Tax=Nocardioides thalensis TaxID=1914755 RepID=A0A853BXT0_9ACTN|nr:hypothetical protein [Nocardioides thalensis]NYI99944.1 integrase [Nocardioides thalensis]